MRKTLSLLMMTAMLLPALTGCRARAEQRTGEAQGYGGPLKVTVTLQDSDITKVRITEHHETPGVGTRAIDALPEAIEKADSIDVDGVSGATVTSNAIKEAVSQAMGGVVQQVIPIDPEAASPAPALNLLTGAGMAATGRVGPGKDADGGQVYSINVVFAAGEFEEDGTIRSMQVDQLEIVTPNLGGGSSFAGFPSSVGDEDRFMQEISAWQTKGAMGDDYMLTSGSWRQQMDAYEQAMTGMTVAEVRQKWGRTATEETAEDVTPAPTAEAVTGATMSLTGEYGDILLAIERAWEDAQRGNHQE